MFKFEIHLRPLPFRLSNFQAMILDGKTSEWVGYFRFSFTVLPSNGHVHRQYSRIQYQNVNIYLCLFTHDMLQITKLYNRSHIFRIQIYIFIYVWRVTFNIYYKIICLLFGYYFKIKIIITKQCLFPMTLIYFWRRL